MRQGLAFFVLDFCVCFCYNHCMITWQSESSGGSYGTSQEYEFFVNYDDSINKFVIDIFDEHIEDTDEAYMQTLLVDATTLEAAKEQAELWLADEINT